ncbi:MAG: hypothetical protein FWB86_06510 [Treponema sp.]|nr:hypothetical protein [Treponema sp.]MCL2250876.1 hypothetical protein [Treponema sp.]
MADSNLTNYIDTLQQCLDAKRETLDKSDLGQLKEELRAFHISYASLYNLFLKKKLIDEDPYKQEAKITEIEVPDATIFQEAKRIEQLTIRLANYDNQLDYLVNFYQLGIDFLNLDRIKRIMGLVRYIDWSSFSADSPNQMTKSVALLTNQSKTGVDALTLNIIGESTQRLNKTTGTILKIIKDLSIYYREKYKLNVRLNITKDMSAGEATMEGIRKKMPSAMPGQPFYKELIDELIKEDYSESGSDLRDSILNILKVKENKPKAAKPGVVFKNILLDGIQVIGGSAGTLSEIASKIDENHNVLESRKKSFFESIKKLIRQITNAAPEEIFYTIEYLDPTKGAPVKEKINYHQFRDDLDKRIRIYNSFARGPAYQKIAAMTEDQIIVYLERYIKELTQLHRTLNSFDEFFKANVEPGERDKIKGIKPDLSALKNSYVKANQLRHEYSAQKEEDDQMKRLGVGTSSPPLPPPLAPANAPPPAPSA